MAARNELLRRGVAVGRLFHHADREGLVGGANPQRKGYASYASFSDPDGNGCVAQEVTARLTGHIEAGDTSFTSDARKLRRLLPKRDPDRL
jgi:hypothetical protein